MHRNDKYECDDCGIRIHKIAFGVRQWDWFTGKLERTYHFCSACKGGEERNRLFALAYPWRQHDNRD